jgi:hypothetical protein
MTELRKIATAIQTLEERCMDRDVIALEPLRDEYQYLLDESIEDIATFPHDADLALFVAEHKQMIITLQKVLDHSEFFQQFMGKLPQSTLETPVEEDAIEMNIHVSEKNDVGEE